MSLVHYEPLVEYHPMFDSTNMLDSINTPYPDERRVSRGFRNHCERKDDKSLSTQQPSSHGLIITIVLRVELMVSVSDETTG